MRSKSTCPTRRRVIGSASPFSTSYLDPNPVRGPMKRRIEVYAARRLQEIARPETRTKSEPLAEWACRRIRLDGRPFSFDGHAYLRAIYDDTSPHVVLVKAAQVGGSTWAIFRAIHACHMGLSVLYLF